MLLKRHLVNWQHEYLGCRIKAWFSIDPWNSRIKELSALLRVSAVERELLWRCPYMLFPHEMVQGTQQCGTDLAGALGASLGDAHTICLDTMQGVRDGATGLCLALPAWPWLLSLQVTAWSRPCWAQRWQAEEECIAITRAKLFLTRNSV